MRYTERDESVYAIMLDTPEREFALRGVDAADVDAVRLLGLDEPLDWRVSDGVLGVRLPERLPVSPAHVLAISAGLRPAG